MKATGRDGTTYSITRRWMPWRRKLELDDAPGSGIDSSGLSGLGDDPFSAIVAFVLGAVLLILAIPAILLFIGVVIELVLLSLLLPIAVLVRVAFGMPWEVEIRDATGWLPWPVVYTEPVKGWRASGERIAELAEEVRLRGVPQMRPADET